MKQHKKNRTDNKRGPLAVILLLTVVVLVVACRHGRVEAAPSEPSEVVETLAEQPLQAPAAPEGAPVGAPYIHIDKQTMTLTLHDADGQPMAVFGVATGINPGNKRRSGDMRTPEGHFRVTQIQDASSWTHDFGDGRGVIAGAYGPRFLRLETPGFRDIGIHGTHDPASIGTRASEGCIRLLNENVDSLARMVSPGIAVIITPGEADINANQLTQ